MIDFRSVSTDGAVTLARARVIWLDGQLQVHTLDGVKLATFANVPKRRHHHVGVWDAETTEGRLTMRLKCVTCGGLRWIRFAAKSAHEVWEEVWRPQ